jgi:hypothetical protein
MELEELKAQWLETDGSPMPEDIASQPLEMVRKAVRWRKAGITVGVGKHVEPTVEVVEDSLMDWDRQDQKNGNAYGGS